MLDIDDLINAKVVNLIRLARSLNIDTTGYNASMMLGGAAHLQLACLVHNRISETKERFSDPVKRDEYEKVWEGL